MYTIFHDGCPHLVCLLYVGLVLACNWRCCCCGPFGSFSEDCKSSLVRQVLVHVCPVSPSQIVRFQSSMWEASHAINPTRTFTCCNTHTFEYIVSNLRNLSSFSKNQKGFCEVAGMLASKNVKFNHPLMRPLQSKNAASCIIS